MRGFIKTGCCFYGFAIVVYGFQQLAYGNFRDVQLPAWQFHIPGLTIWAFITGLVLIATGAAIIFDIKAKKILLLLGAIFLSLVCFVHVPYELISEPNKPYHLGLWTGALKELALSGGAFVLAGSFPETATSSRSRFSFTRLLEKLIPYGSIFFCITIVSFGITHFMYTDFVAKLVPRRMPDPEFWAYVAGVALIGSGAFIILNIRRKLIAVLMAIMIFHWFILLHLPAAIENPTGARGNELASAFDALAYSGIALVIAFGRQKQAFDNIQ